MASKTRGSIGVVALLSRYMTWRGMGFTSEMCCRVILLESKVWALPGSEGSKEQASENALHLSKPIVHCDTMQRNYGVPELVTEEVAVRHPV